MTDPTATIDVHAATPERWNAVAIVMGTRGDPAGCWCQFFRISPTAFDDAAPAEHRSELARQVRDQSRPPGVLAYLEGEAVGWCAVAPKVDYPRIAASRITGADTEGVWSVSCFVVRVGYRRRGIAAALLRGAVELARSGGAVAVEGYPIDPAARASVSSAELYRGTLSLYTAAGFVEKERPSRARAVVRLEL